MSQLWSGFFSKKPSFLKYIFLHRETLLCIHINKVFAVVAVMALPGVSSILMSLQSQCLHYSYKDVLQIVSCLSKTLTFCILTVR